MPGRGVLAILVVVVLVVLAGCSSAGVENTPAADTSGQPVVETSGAPDGTTAADTATSTPGTTTTPPPDNPWEKSVVTVRVNNTATDRDHGPMLRPAIEFWNENGDRYAEYDVEFEVADPSATPDIEIRVVPRIDTCTLAPEQRIVTGCARLLDADSQPNRPEVIRIAAGLTDAQAPETMKHELGHTLGLTHDDAPADVMEHGGGKPFIEKPDVDEREYPWLTHRFDVYVRYPETATEREREETVEALDHAFSYYEDGAEGHAPTGLTFEYVEEAERADVAITVTRSGDLGSERREYGIDIDQDDRLEYYTYYEIDLHDLPYDRRAWHVGYWLGFLLGADSVEDLPPPFDDPQSDRRERWWDD